MSWLYSRALVEEYSGGISLDGGRSALSNGTHTPQAYLSPDKMTDFCRPSRFGMTFAPLTADLGRALLTWFLAASPARTYPQPGPAQDLTAQGLDCGWRWHESSMKYDRPSASWKTRQCSLLGDLEPFSGTWPRWGTMRNGECWERQTWERRTSGNESGSWPTPCSRDHKGGADWSLRQRDGKPRKLSDMTLPDAVRMWPTPTKSDGCGGPGRSGRDGGMNLRTAAGGSLNPTWVEWLMGWPLGWTDLSPWEMDRCHDARQKLG